MENKIIIYFDHTLFEHYVLKHFADIEKEARKLHCEIQTKFKFELVACSDRFNDLNKFYNYLQQRIDNLAVYHCGLKVGKQSMIEKQLKKIKNLNYTPAEKNGIILFGQQNDLNKVIEEIKSSICYRFKKKELISYDVLFTSTTVTRTSATTAPTTTTYDDDARRNSDFYPTSKSDNLPDCIVMKNSIGEKIHFLLGDICKMKVDCIVCGTTKSHEWGLMGQICKLLPEIPKKLSFPLRDIVIKPVNRHFKYVVLVPLPASTSHLEYTFKNMMQKINMIRGIKTVAFPILGSVKYGSSESCFKMLLDEIMRAQLYTSIPKIFIVDIQIDFVHQTKHMKNYSNFSLGNEKITKELYGAETTAKKDLDTATGCSQSESFHIRLNANETSVTPGRSSTNFTGASMYEGHRKSYNGISKEKINFSEETDRNFNDTHEDYEFETSSSECSICFGSMISKETLTCGHSFCKKCVNDLRKHKTTLCPICRAIFETLEGSQPPGEMTFKTTDECLPGHEDCGTIIISYIFQSGRQTKDHPNPGRLYKGTVRKAYLPDSAEGNKVYALLRKAFDQHLTFTIGRSSTSGKENSITWNDVHHKTSKTGGPENHGYPDEGYLQRVQEELRLKGITC